MHKPEVNHLMLRFIHLDIRNEWLHLSSGLAISSTRTLSKGHLGILIEDMKISYCTIQHHDHELEGNYDAVLKYAYAKLATTSTGNLMGLEKVYICQ